MKVFTVHESVGAPADRIDRAERLVFVGDGVRWSAFLFPPFVLTAQRLWVALGLYGVALAGLFALFFLIGATPGWYVIGYLALNAFVAFELGELHRTLLDAQGWTTLGTVCGANLAECERRYFTEFLAQQPVMTNLRTASTEVPSAGGLPGVGATPSRRGLSLPWARNTR
jgi:hypothetical protein